MTILDYGLALLSAKDQRSKLLRAERKWVEKLRFMHRNPATRGLVLQPED